jgi:hypothetical protein
MFDVIRDRHFRSFSNKRFDRPAASSHKKRAKQFEVTVSIGNQNAAQLDTVKPGRINLPKPWRKTKGRK